MLPILCQAQQEEYTIIELGRCKTGVAYDVFVAGNYAYATTNKGVAILDIVDKKNPEKISVIKSKEPVFGVTVKDDNVYHVTMDREFIITNKQNPEKPEIIGSIKNLDTPYKIVVENSYAYITQDNGNMIIVDVKNPANPTLIGSYEFTGAGRGIAVMDNILYVAVRGRGLMILDVVNPTSLELKSEIPVEGSARSIDVYKNLLIVGSHTGPVNIFKITDPLAPKKVSSVNDGGEAYGVSTANDILVIADLQRGILAYDISDPENPHFLSKIHCPAHSVYYDGDFIYVSAETGFFIFKLLDSKVTNSIGMKLKLVRAGTFIMGADDGGPIGQSKPAHEVTLTYDFYMGIYEVTQFQYENIMGENPSDFTDPDLPVAGISFEKAEEFCKILSHKEGVNYRLPYEAEWEYVYRAGTTTTYPWGDDLNSADDYGWHEGNSHNKPHPVGLKNPNDWGFYDMSGNVQELTKDIYGLYKPQAVLDPKGALKPWGTLDCTLRSGSYELAKELFDASFRHGIEKNSDNPGNTIGFRVVREIK